jgi:iron complex outermembrane receptor protein
VQIDFNAVIPGSNRGTIETTNAAGNGRSKGIEADLTLAPMRGLTLTASYAYTHVKLPQAPNPFVAGNPLVTVYPIYTPDHAASAAIDYEVPIADAKLMAHLDANYGASQYTMVSDPTKTGSSVIVNGRLALGGLKMPGTGAELIFAVWTRNLFNYSYTFVRSYSSALGTYGVFNEPRTFGFQANVKFQ